jgi:molybdopterin molybdotransferase
VDELLGIDEALELVLARVQPLEGEQVALDGLLGRTLAADARAAVDLPSFPSSAMDGYAVRAVDAPGTLAIVGRSAAGRPADRRLGAGEAIEISTGAVVPEGADAVVPVELTQPAGEAAVTVAEPVDEGDNVRPVGGDARAGDVVVEAGTRLGPAQIGALAAAGLPAASCARRPRVNVLATGTELRRPGEQLRPGEIYESNTALLAAQLFELGAVVDVASPVADDAAATEAALERALAADVVVTSGGVSVGPHDLVRATLAGLGVEEVFWRVAVKPGKPVAFGVRGRTLVFGLPGNPVSALVGFELLVRPALLALQGRRNCRPPFLPGRLLTPLRRNRARDELVRARSRVEGEAVVLAPLPGQDSHMIVRAAGADALVLVPRGEGELPARAHVSYLRI